MEPFTPQMSPRKLKCPDAPKKTRLYLTPPSSPRPAIECPGAPKKTRQLYSTPPNSPRSESKCPGAPTKMPRCNGCHLFETGYGGENQEAHMDKDGCLSTLE